MLEIVVVGAGPYGLSMAANLRHRGISFRIFGRLMDSWVSHMPVGMKLKSDGFASNIDDPEARYTLEKFCAERGIEYGHTGVPVRLDTFTSYGAAFRDRMVPELEDKMVTGVEQVADGFRVTLSDGESFLARQVILAVGITHYEYMPEVFTGLPSSLVTHSARHREVAPFRGREVVVIGAGASALDLAALLQEAGAKVQLISRRKELKFHSKPTGKPRTLWQRLRHPQSGLGPGLRSRFYSNWAWAFYYIPKGLRLKVARRALGPSGGWFVSDMIMGKVPTCISDLRPSSVEVVDGKVRLHLRARRRQPRKNSITGHVITATGYKVDMNRLKFLNPEIRSQIKTFNGSPDFRRLLNRRCRAFTSPEFPPSTASVL